MTRTNTEKAPHSYRDGVPVEIGCEEAQELIESLQAEIERLQTDLMHAQNLLGWFVQTGNRYFEEEANRGRS